MCLCLNLSLLCTDFQQQWICGFVLLEFIPSLYRFPAAVDLCLCLHLSLQISVQISSSSGFGSLPAFIPSLYRFPAAVDLGLCLIYTFSVQISSSSGLVSLPAFIPSLYRFPAAVDVCLCLHLSLLCTDFQQQWIGVSACIYPFSVQISSSSGFVTLPAFIPSLYRFPAAVDLCLCLHLSLLCTDFQQQWIGVSACIYPFSVQISSSSGFGSLPEFIPSLYRFPAAVDWCLCLHLSLHCTDFQQQWICISACIYPFSVQISSSSGFVSLPEFIPSLYRFPAAVDLCLCLNLSLLCTDSQQQWICVSACIYTFSVQISSSSGLVSLPAFIPSLYRFPAAVDWCLCLHLSLHCTDFQQQWIWVFA